MPRRSKKNKKYPAELKLEAVQDYLNGGGSQREIKERSCAKGEIYMTKGRKTTQEERAEIVAFYIERGKDYGLAVETYKVSYQQIYAWIHKYEEKGVQGLTDLRGKSKPENELTDEDRLRQENKILQAKIKVKTVTSRKLTLQKELLQLKV